MKHNIYNHWKTYCILFLIFFVGIFFRLYNVNWDQGFHLHPDERFLTMVGLKEQLPHTFLDYFNPSHSLLNPTVVGFSFFVYGVFPLTINILLSTLFHTQTYDLFTLQGRVLSALFDSTILLVIYKMAKRLVANYQYPKIFSFLAVFFYAISVLPIQLSHFYTVDLFANFFGFTSFYFILEFFFTKKFRYIIFSSIFLGLAIASKVSALLFFPLNVVLLFITFLQSQKLKRKVGLGLLLVFLEYIFTMYLTVRLFDPYPFASANFFIPTLNKNFLTSLYILYGEYSPHTFFPPAFQWLNKIPVVFGLYNIAVYGLGIPYAITTIIGMGNLINQKKIAFSIILLWTVAILLLEGMQFAQTMRYFIYFYPFFALYAALASVYVYQKLGKIILFFVLFTSSIWTLMFFSIYTKSHTRISASNWIYYHIPNGSTILTEYWDDTLPLPLSINKQYKNVLLPIFDPDTALKWKKMSNDLQQGNYLILSSNRGWGTIRALRQKFPLTSTFYDDLFHNRLRYKKIAEFNSYPSLSYLGIPMTVNDTAAEEAFTVNDHPTVFIFQHQ